MRTSQFNSRIVVGSVLILAVAFVVYLSHGPGAWLFGILMAAAVALAQREYYQMAEAKEYYPLYGVGIGFSVAYLMALFVTQYYGILAPLPQMVLLLALLATFLMSFLPRPEPLVNSAITLFGIGYLALPLGAIIVINYFPFTSDVQDGRWWLIYLIAVTKITDIAALLVGKLWGKRPLALRISPNKTVEGALAGFLAAFGLSLLFGAYAPLAISLTESAILGIVFGVFSQFGDLAESILKRDAKVKDSSQLPGLGGVLDVVDSLVFTAPTLLFFLQWNSGA